MTQIVNQILDVLPAAPAEGYSAYAAKKLVIFRSSRVITGFTFFTFYEFIMSHDAFPLTQVGENIITPEADRIFPVNCGQWHGSLITESVPCRFTIMYIQREFLQEIARNIYGESKVFFTNGNFMIPDHFRHLIQSFMDEASGNQPGRDYILESLSTQISICLLRTLESNLSVLKECAGYSDKMAVTRTIEFFKENYHYDYTSEGIAQRVNLSPYHFIRIFKAETGKTPYQYLMDIKIEKAREFLCSKDRTVTDVCFLSGFRNLSHFTTVFKQRTGVSPSEYRRHYYENVK